MNFLSTRPMRKLITDTPRLSPAISRKRFLNETSFTTEM